MSIGADFYSQFGGSLAHVEWHADESLGHQCKIQADPANTIGREQDAAIAFLQIMRGEKNPSLCDE